MSPREDTVSEANRVSPQDTESNPMRVHSTTSSRARRLLRATAVLVIALYCLYGAALFGLQRRLVFAGTSRGAPEAPELPRDAVATTVSGEFGEVEVWVLPAQDGPSEASETGSVSGPAIVFAHGNGELIDDWVTRFGAFQELGYTIALVEFPGYGRSSGAPTQESVVGATVAAFDLLEQRDDVDAASIYAIGRSLGGGAAAALALERPVAGLVLRSSFSSLRPMAHGLLLPSFLLRDPFDNEDAVEHFAGPVLVLHGHTDQVVPYWHSDRTLEAAGDRGTRISMQCGHNDCPWDGFAAQFDEWARETER